MWGQIIGAGIGAAGSLLASKSARGKAAKLDKRAIKMAESLNARADDFMSQSRDQWNFYKEYGQPLDIMAINETMQRVKQGPEAAVARASADVNTAYDRAEAIRTRSQQRYGDPTSGGAITELQDRSELDRARSEVGARNLSRRQEQDDIWRQLMQTREIGQQAIGNATRAGIVETNMRTGAIDAFTGGAQRAASDAAGIGSFVGDLASKVPWQDVIDRVFKPTEPADVPQQGESSNVQPGDWYAQGGMVRPGPAIPTGRPMAGPVPVAGRQIAGPGSGTSDSVPAVVDGQRPAALSNGEFVIPAEVVRRKGTEFFEKLIASVQQPQRGAV